MKNVFTWLLGAYFIFLCHHAIHEISWIMTTGIGVATISHARRGWLTPVLLLGHTSVEWLEWSHDAPALFLGWAFRLAHAGMDVAFYRHEVSAHKRKSFWLWGGAIFLIFFVSLGFTFRIPEEILEAIHPFVLGGTLGCVGTHLWFHFFKESRA